ncbi:late secretory pathway protein AVL9 homolog [Dermatophagoides pteronyssinus]|uniref:late secretory pathway protein AVL9 homolog n=1 Tax=Dermatophagoides pteronyssinus TaxID=6956 RepID=UPI003F681B86
MNQSKSNESIQIDQDNNQSNCSILYVMVVGFHHKKGCLIDYCYPSLPKSCTNSSNNNNNNNNESNCDKITNNSTTTNELQLNQQDLIKLPDCWKSLPSLAIPDGAHNFERDSVYFHLPDLFDPTRTVFGVACYQQIMTKILRVRTPDMTRSSVQKSVVAIITAPLYGLVERKLRIITRNYFQELDFSKTQILNEFYQSMSLQLRPTLIKTNEIYYGLSLRNLFQKFGQQIIILFKLLLLEKKTLFIMSPIRDLSCTILTLCSLFPGLLSNGLLQSHLPSEIKSTTTTTTKNPIKSLTKISTNPLNDSNQIETKSESKSNPNNDYETNPTMSILSKSNDMSSSITSTISLYDQEDQSTVNQMDLNSFDGLIDLNDEFYDDNDDDPRSEYSETNSTNRTIRDSQEILIKPDEYYGLPLQLFKCHSYCLPYCSISCFEMLNNPNVRSCLAGSSNSIFQRWENDFDVFVVDNQISINNNHLKRILTPTVEDLRFISFLLRSMNESTIINNEHDDDDNDNNKRYQPESEDYNEYVENLEQNQHYLYEGSDSWCRYHFKNYLIHMLRCSFMDETNKEYRAFNAGFMAEWKQTYSYKHWLNSQNIDGKSIEEIFQTEIVPEHPFAANRLNDIRFKITNFLNNRQEHINNASKVVINSAKSTFNSWISSLGSYHSNAGQQAKLFINKTVQFANQLIEDPNQNDDDFNEKKESNITTSSSSSSSSSDNDDERRKQRYRHRLKTKTSSKQQQKHQSNQRRQGQEHSSKRSSDFNLDESDPDVEEQETSV